MVQWIWTSRDESFFDAVPGIDLRCSWGRIGVMVAVVVMAITSLMEMVKEDGEVKFELSVERKGGVIWVGMERKGMKEEGVCQLRLVEMDMGGGGGAWNKGSQPGE
ncbi:hypothetical protein SDJN03_14987, partial [Cucurbita argyrosperma subsp. sororia]